LTWIYTYVGVKTMTLPLLDYAAAVGSLTPEQVAKAQGTLDYESWQLRPDLGTHPVYAPYGILNASVFYDLYQELAYFPIDAKTKEDMTPFLLPAAPFLPEAAHYTCCMPGSFYWYADNYAFTSEFPLKNLTDGSNCSLSDGRCGVRLSYFPFQISGLFSHSDYMETIAETAAAIKDTGFSLRNVYPQGPNYVFWEVFENLFVENLRIFLITEGVMLVVSLLILGDVGSVIVIFTICVSIVLQVGGFIFFFGNGLDWNIFTSWTLLAAVAIAIEDVAHTVTFFLAAHGSGEEKLAAAMKDAFIAIIEGSISTLVSIIPMAFHPAPFFLIYFVLPMSTLVVVGIINGVVFVPAILITINMIKESFISCAGMQAKTVMV
jgi:hypothetical protein